MGNGLPFPLLLLLLLLVARDFIGNVVGGGAPPLPVVVVVVVDVAAAGDPPSDAANDVSIAAAAARSPSPSAAACSANDKAWICSYSAGCFFFKENSRCKVTHAGHDAGKSSASTSADVVSANGLSTLVVHRASAPSNATNTSNGTHPGSLHSISCTKMCSVGSSAR